MTQKHLAHGAILGRMGPIIEAVLRRYQLEREALDKPGRAIKAICEARWVCYWAARELELPLSDTEIAVVFQQGPTAARLGRLRITAQRKRDAWLRENTDALLAELRA